MTALFLLAGVRVLAREWTGVIYSTAVSHIFLELDLTHGRD